MTSSGPLVVLLGDGPLPDGLEQAVADRCTAERGRLLGTLEPGGARGLDAVVESAGADPVVLVDARALSVATVYGDVAADPRPDTAVLRTTAGQVVALRVRAEDVPALGEPGLAGWATPAQLLEHTSAVLAARGPVREITPGDFPLVLVDDDGLAAALATVDAVDEDALRLRRASRSDDGFLSTFLVRPLSRRLTRHAVRRGLTPASITGVSLTLGLASAAAYTGGGRGWLLLGSVLLLCSLVVDCVDGEVARYTRTFSPLGGWLDVASDRIKEYAVYAGLVAGVARATGESLWGLALASLALLVVRHFVDFGFAASGVGAGPATGGVAALSESTSRVPAVMWAKRAVIMPVGERTLLLVALVPLVGVRWTLWLLLASGLVAAAYTTAGRLGRALASRAGGPPRLSAADRLVGQCDAAPLPAGVLPVSGRFGWLTPGRVPAGRAGARARPRHGGRRPAAAPRCVRRPGGRRVPGVRRHLPAAARRGDRDPGPAAPSRLAGAGRAAGRRRGPRAGRGRGDRRRRPAAGAPRGGVVRRGAAGQRPLVVRLRCSAHRSRRLSLP